MHAARLPHEYSLPHTFIPHMRPCAHKLALCACIEHLSQEQFINLTKPLAGDQQAATTGLFAGPDTNDLTTAQGQLQQARSRLGQSYARIPPEYQQVMS